MNKHFFVNNCITDLISTTVLNLIDNNYTTVYISTVGLNFVSNSFDNIGYELNYISDFLTYYCIDFPVNASCSTVALLSVHNSSHARSNSDSNGLHVSLSSYDLWHDRLGHPNSKVVLAILKTINLSHINVIPKLFCDAF